MRPLQDLRRRQRPSSALRPALAAVTGALSAAFVSSAAMANPVITEVAWMGSDASANDEWIEIFNPDAQPIDTADFVLIEGATAKPLPAGTIPDLGFLILERQPSSTPLEAPLAQPFSFTNGLANTGEVLCLCPAAATSCDATCDIANPGGDWFAGSNTVPKASMERVDIALDGALATSWQDGSPSSPGAPSAAPQDAGPPPDDAGVEDAGVVVDAGELPDAGPNTPPTVTLSEPAGTATGDTVDVVYSASDPDPGDAVSVDLYWSLDGEGHDGTRFARGLPGGLALTAALDTTLLPPGTVHVFAVARDTRGDVAFAYAPGVVDVGGGSAGEASFELKEPDGVNDTQEDGAVTIAWDLVLPADAAGTVTLFIDDDDEGEDGEPIAGGLSAGLEGPRAYRLLLEGLEPGEHFIYGVLDYTSPGGHGRVSSYADASVQVASPGCACTGQGPGRAPSLPAVASLAILLLPLLRRNRPTART